MHLLTQSALLRALGWTLLNSLWQMGLLWLTWLALTRIFSQAASRFRHGLALALLAFGALGSVVTFFSAYLFDDGGFGVSRAIGFGTGNRITLVLPYCSSLYLLILGGLLIRYSHQYLYSRRLTRAGLSKIPAEFRVFVTSISRRMGIRPAVNVSLSALVDVPMTMGFWKPVILFPVAMISQLSTQQVEAILVHELAHIRRNDYLLNFGVTVIGLLFFFNPFTRMLIHQLQREREHCCDDEVLQFDYDPHAYVSALLSLARQHRQARVALAATGAGGEQLLLQRARKILQQKRTDRRPGARPFILLFLTAAITVFSLSSPPKAVDRQQPALPQPAAGLIGSKEMVFVTIVNTGAPAPAEPKHAAPRNSASRAGSIGHADRPADDQETAARLFAEVASAGNRPGASSRGQTEANSGDQAGASSSDQADAGTLVLTQPATLTFLAPRAKRDNSLGKTEDEDEDEQGPAADDVPPTENLVFVPNSSFSFKNIDTLRPEDRLTWIEESTEREIRTQVEKLQRELGVQLELLRREEARARSLSNASQKQLKQLLNEQMLLQRDYLKKLDNLHLRLKKATRRLTTVYI
ncbi:MAG TPA: M56 family metallopeptidase [Puia sp.]|nr:M56 family metallopeptidase [Puia sp.]